MSFEGKNPSEIFLTRSHKLLFSAKRRAFQRACAGAALAAPRTKMRKAMRV